MVDYQTQLLDPIYLTLGVPGVITLADDTVVDGLTVIDKTAGVLTGDNAAKVDTLEPGCCIRAAEWYAKGRTFADFEGASVEFNGSRWDIVAYPKRPTPTGAKTGEVLLILQHETEIESSP